MVAHDDNNGSVSGCDDIDGSNNSDGGGKSDGGSDGNSSCIVLFCLFYY